MRAKEVLEEEYALMRARHELLHHAKQELRDGFVAEAVYDLISVVRMLSDSEERVMRLHAECAAMLKQAGKILELDAMRRPVVIQLATDSPSEEPK
jgi:hypothetical protein